MAFAAERPQINRVASKTTTYTMTDSVSPSPPPPPSGQVASPARAASSARDVCIFGAIRMPLRAVGLLHIRCRHSMPTQHIDLDRHRFHVDRTNTGAGATEMVDCQAVRNGAPLQFIGKAMGLHEPSFIRESSIARPIPDAYPEPTGIRLFDLRPEPPLRVVAEGRQGGQWVAVLAPPLVVLSAPATKIVGRLVAIWNATLNLHGKVTPFLAMQPDASTSRLPSLYQGAM